MEAFIEKCKESVFTYEKQWRAFTEELGYWVDMDDPYVTLSNTYIESVWNILVRFMKKVCYIKDIGFLHTALVVKRRLVHMKCTRL